MKRITKIGVGIGILMLGACGGGEDSQAPTVQITQPTNGDTLWANPGLVLTTTVKATANDNEGVDHVTFYANGSPIETDNSAPYEITWTTGIGSYSLTAEAYDATGNMGASAPVHVLVGAKDTVYGDNQTDVDIYDFTWSSSSIGWTGSSDWWVEKVDVELYLYHTWPTDLYIDLESPQGTYGLIVDRTLPGDPDWVYLTKTFETEFDGEMVFNDYWTLWICDHTEYDEGYLDWWAITVYCCNTGGPAALAGQKEEKVIRIVGRPGKTGHGGRAPLVVSGKDNNKK